MSPPPTFSIVTACKNGLSFLKETAAGILGQDYPHWEWVFIDDHSEEPIGEYIQNLRDPRIFFHRNQTSIGQTKSLNFGIQQSQGPWIVRLDGDDIPHPQKLSKTLVAIESRSHPPSLLFSDYDIIQEDGSFLAAVKFQSPISENFYRYLLEKNNPICHPTVTFSRLSPQGKLVQYDESLQNAQDYALWKKLLHEKSHSFLHIPHSLLQYRLVRQSLSGARAKEQAAELKKIRGRSASRIPTLTLTPQQQEGMYAFRVLFYRFLAAGKKGPSYKRQDFSSLLLASRYLKNLPKAMFFFAARICPVFFKQRLFSGIYQ